MLKSLDLYKKLRPDIDQPTVYGGVLTIVSISLMLSMLFIEGYQYLTVSAKREMRVYGFDINDRMRVDVKIEILQLSCDEVQMIYFDKSGAAFSPSLYKLPLDKHGEYAIDIDVSLIERLERSVGVQDCGSCYGAEMYEGQCCNTCEDVLEAYAKAGWRRPEKHSIYQCQTKLDVLFPQSYGCMLIGSFNVKRLEGGVQISMHPLAMMFRRQNLPISHRIHRFSITDPRSPELYKPTALEGYQVVGDYVSNYYLTLIPAILPSGQKYYEYTALKNHIPDPTFSINFYYELDALVVHYKYPQTFLRFLINLCAMIGGWYALSTLIARAITKLG